MGTQRQRGDRWVLCSWLPLCLLTKAGMRPQQPQPRGRPEGNMFVIRANVNCAAAESGSLLPHRKTLLLFLSTVLHAGVNFSPEKDGSLNNTVFLFFPQMPAMPRLTQRGGNSFNF